MVYVMVFNLIIHESYHEQQNCCGITYYKKQTNQFVKLSHILFSFRISLLVIIIPSSIYQI